MTEQTVAVEQLTANEQKVYDMLFDVTQFQEDLFAGCTIGDEACFSHESLVDELKLANIPFDASFKGTLSSLEKKGWLIIQNTKGFEHLYFPMIDIRQE